MKKADICINCGKHFSDANVYSEAGWKETQITQLCELCFDQITKDPEDLDVDDEFEEI